MEEPLYKLKKLLKELSSIKGRHTELVTVYIPAGYSISDVSNQLKNEQGTAINIKSKAVRKNVLGALERAIQHLKLYKQTPPHGLAIFSGNVSENEGVSDVQIWAVEPPEPLNVKLYWCDQRFELAPLEEMVKEKDIFGIVVMDNQQATIAHLRGKKLKIVRKLDSIVPGKFRAGGQSAARFGRVREGLINDFYKKIAGTMKDAFHEEIKGIILGGPGPAKNKFYEGDYIQTAIRNKILGIRDTGYTDEHGLHEIVERSQDLLSEAEVAKEKQLVKKFLGELQKGSGMVTYGFLSVKNAVEQGAADIVLISDGLDELEVELQCNCGYAYKKFLKGYQLSDQKCPKCGGQVKLIGERDVIESFEEMVKDYGTSIEIISRDTREGEQLFQMGGIAALLRYKL